MYSDMGIFALRQIVSSLVIVGPLLMIISALSLAFNQSRRRVLIYLLLGCLLTAIGAASLHGQF